MADEETGDERAQTLLEQGASLYEEGKLYDAISCWREVLDIDPGNEIAAEYLRFIEDNFQIGIDAFLEHHRPDTRTFDGDETDLEAAIDESINAILDDSIEELDWSELLDEGPDDTPPPPSDVAEADEAFFPALEPGSLSARPGDEAEAWGATPSRPGVRPRTDGGAMGQSVEMMPDVDPFALPVGRFAMPLSPGEAPPDPVDEATDAEPSRPAADRSEERPRRDLSEMSDDSIDLMLDEDFRAWEENQNPEELPFETPQSQPPRPGSSPPADEPRRPRAPADGVQIERRQPPVYDGPRAGLPDAVLRHSTGPLTPVDPRTREVAGVDRLGRTTPPPAGREQRPSSMPPPPPPEALRPRDAAPSPDRPVLRDTASTPVISEVPAEIADAAQLPSSSTELAPERLDASSAGSTPSTAARETPAAATPPAPEQTPAAPEPAAPPPAPAEPAAPAPEPADEPPADTDLDDELRALLSAGIAAIDAVHKPAPTEPRQLISAPPPGTDLDALMVDARRRQQADDFSGAIALVEQVLAGDPDHAEARRYLEENTSRLLAMYRTRLGGLGRVPRVKLRQQEIVWQSLDHREGFILSQVDGRTSFEEIIDIAGMAELESTRILARLVDHGVIG